MKLSVLALDYDGTVARDDRLDPAVREAITEARRRGIKVMLVTGRTVNALRRVAGELNFVDGVVAENGAMCTFQMADSPRLSHRLYPRPSRLAFGSEGFRSQQANALSMRMRAPLLGCLKSSASSSFPLCSCSIEAA
jgi:ribonucleotide monophosphatase NagD (HAD superfamily)